MKKLLFIAAAIAMFSGEAQAQQLQYQKGYFRDNGTYVAPHYRTAPDGNPYNNYGCQYNGNC